MWLLQVGRGNNRTARVAMHYRQSQLSVHCNIWSPNADTSDQGVQLLGWEQAYCFIFRSNTAMLLIIYIPTVTVSHTKVMHAVCQQDIQYYAVTLNTKIPYRTV